MLKLARVVDAHPESHSVDVVVLDDNRRFGGVRVLAGSAGGDFGSSGLAVPTNTGFEARNSGQRDIFAVIAWVGVTPVVMGFLHPQVSQVLFADKERAINRHPSDVYSSIDANGNAEFYHPSGAFIRIGTDPSHEDLSGKDVDGIWAIKRNTDKAVHIHVEQAGGAAVLDIAPNGAITVHTGQTLTVSADGGATITAPTVQVNGDVHVSGDVVAGSVSLKNHTHGGVQGGSAHSAKPD